jgi:DNA primase
VAPKPKRRPARRREELPVERARQTSILAVARRLGLGNPEPCGREWKVRCPFHDDDHPSLGLNDEDGVWFCHPCGEGGDTITLVERVEGLGFADAVRWITR